MYAKNRPKHRIQGVQVINRGSASMESTDQTDHSRTNDRTNDRSIHGGVGGGGGDTKSNNPDLVQRPDIVADKSSSNSNSINYGDPVKLESIIQDSHQDMKAINDGIEKLHIQDGHGQANFNIKQNPVSKLQELCIACKLKVPEYKFLSETGPPHSRMFEVQVHVAGITAVCFGSSKKLAKTKAAEIALLKLEEQNYLILESKAEQESKSNEEEDIKDESNHINQLSTESIMNSSVTSSELSFEEQKLDPSNISELMEYCAKNGYLPPEFISDQTGPSHIMTFTVECRIKELNISGKGTSPKKAFAKRIAAYEVNKQIESLNLKAPLGKVKKKGFSHVNFDIDSIKDKFFRILETHYLETNINSAVDSSNDLNCCDVLQKVAKELCCEVVYNIFPSGFNDAEKSVLLSLNLNLTGTTVLTSWAKGQDLIAIRQKAAQKALIIISIFKNL